MVKISASKARTQLAELLNSIKYGGERVILSKHNQDYAALISIDDLKVLEELEDYFDLMEARQALEEYERTGESITLDDLLAEIENEER